MMLWLSTLSRPLKVYQVYRRIKAWFTFTLFYNQILFHFSFFIGFMSVQCIHSAWLFWYLLLIENRHTEHDHFAWFIKNRKMSAWYFYFDSCLLTRLSKLSTVTTIDFYLPTKAVGLLYWFTHPLLYFEIMALETGSIPRSSLCHCIS
jgi:hypothetical protein